MSSDDDNEVDNDSGDGVEENGDERHVRMLEGITGMPGEAFEGIVLKIL